MLYEMRTYQCLPGRLPLLLRRFESATLAIWKRHGIAPIGFWTNVIGPSNHELVYLLSWKSLSDRERMWDAFMKDPEWVKTRDESERDGPIVANVKNSILQPTSFSNLQ